MLCGTFNNPRVILSSKGARSDDQIIRLNLQGSQISGINGNGMDEKIALRNSSSVKYRDFLVS